jgi:hypothetical protein
LATFEPFISKSIRSNQFEKHRQEISKGLEGKKLSTSVSCSNNEQGNKMSDWTEFNITTYPPPTAAA